MKTLMQEQPPNPSRLPAARPPRRLAGVPVFRDVRLPVAGMRWRVEKAGFASILRVGPTGEYD